MRKGQEGFATVSLLLTIAVSSIIAVGAGMTTAQVTRVTRQSADYTTAVRQSQNLGHWVSQDMLNTETVTTADDGATAEVEFIIFNWKEWETGNLYEARYYWADQSGALKNVKRKYTTRDNQAVITGTLTTLVAENILSANMSLQSGDRWRLTVAAQSGNRTRTRGYEINKRVQ